MILTVVLADWQAATAVNKGALEGLSLCLRKTETGWLYLPLFSIILIAGGTFFWPGRSDEVKMSNNLLLPRPKSSTAGG